MKKSIKIWSVCCLLSVLAFSCSDMDEADKGMTGKPTLTFNMTRSPQSIIDNTQVYQFDTGWDFKQKVLGVSPGTDKLSMSIATGNWNLALVAANENIFSDVIPPVAGQARTGKLWQTQSLGGELPSVPELRTAYLDNVNVVANTQNTAGPADLYRNVALVKVVIDKTRGLDVAGTHSFKLESVPTTINWAGGLYPNKSNPDVSSDPMKGAFTITAKNDGSGIQESDTLQFIIPAHKGLDFLSPNPADTATHKLNLSVDLACLGGTRFQADNVVIPRVPRVNGILIVKLTMVGQLEVNAEILDWTDVDLNADISQTQLSVDKSKVGLAYRDTIHVNTNASSFTVDKEAGADWLTYTVDGNMIRLEANVNTYVDNSPRSSYITIKTNNVTKKIPVTQRPDRGTISVSAKEMVMSPPNPTKPLTVTTIGGDWEIIGTTTKATPSISSGNVGDSSLSFTRTSTTYEELYSAYYGDTLVVFKNKQTLDTDTVCLSNLFIGIEDGLIEVDQPVAHPDTTSYIDNVQVFGGNTRNLVILNKPDWVHPAPETYYNPSTGIFTFVCDREPNEEERYGEMVLMHADDHDYTVTVKILQDILVRIPEFHYFVVQFKWQSGDVDIKVGFTNNPTSVVVDGVTYPTSNVSLINNKWVGYGQTAGGVYLSVPPGTRYVPYNGQALLQWGNDATSGNRGETAFFNAPIINSEPYPGQYGVTSSTANMLPRKLILRVHCAWWSSTTNAADKLKPMECNIYCYKDGTMVHNGDTWYDNVGGSSVWDISRTFKVNKTVSSATSGDYEHICDIIYDRKKHTAEVQWYGTPFTTRSSVVLPSPPTSLQPDEIAYYEEMRNRKMQEVQD